MQKAENLSVLILPVVSVYGDWPVQVLQHS